MGTVSKLDSFKTSEGVISKIRSVTSDIVIDIYRSACFCEEFRSGHFKAA